MPTLQLVWKSVTEAQNHAIMQMYISWCDTNAGWVLAAAGGPWGFVVRKLDILSNRRRTASTHATLQDIQDWLFSRTFHRPVLREVLGLVPSLITHSSSPHGASFYRVQRGASSQNIYYGIVVVAQPKFPSSRAALSGLMTLQWAHGWNRRNERNWSATREITPTLPFCPQ